MNRERSLMLIFVIGIFLTVIEMLCYIVFFLHVTAHNNRIAATVLQPCVIKQRNRTNAISMLGLFATWFLQMCYIIGNGLLISLFEEEWIREYSTLLKDFKFVWIPWIEIVTSAPINRFRSYSKNK
jgi:hypothetical protein